MFYWIFVLLCLSRVHAQAQNESLFWGTYRPNLYFGTRTRSETNFMTGLMWFGAKSFEDRAWQSRLLNHSKRQVFDTRVIKAIV